MVRFRLGVRYLGFLLVPVLINLLWPATSAQNPTTIRSSSSLVLVPVSAPDKSGHFVGGLGVHDFQILVDGKPVEIASFDAVTENAPSSSVGSQVTASLPPNTFRNISELSSSQPNLVILFIDYLNTRLVDRMALREGMLKYLATKLQPDQEIAVYGLTDRLVVLQPFTREPSSLIAIAKNLLKQRGRPPDPKVGKGLTKPGEETREAVAAAGPGSDAAMEYFAAKDARKEYNLDQLHRAQRTLEAFRVLAGSYGGIPGKKTVIWLTGDVSPLNPSLLYRILVNNMDVQTEATPWWEMAKTYELLSAAGISIFPLDIRGIANLGLLSAGDNLSHDEFTQTFRGSQPDDMSAYANPTDLRQGEAANAGLAMDAVATETGGKVLAGSNDIGELLRRANGLWSSYYVLAFVPERLAEKSEPSYHKIKVNVDRKEVQILARRGYVSRPDSLILADSEIQRDLREAAGSPIDLTSVPLELSLRELKGGGSIRHYPFSIKVSSALLGAASEKGAQYDLTVAFLVRDQDGRFDAPVAKRLKGAVPQTEISRVTANGMKYDAEFETPAGGPYFGRVIVRDNLTGRIGTITVALLTTP